jgi:cellulose synthase/poly-beta-1,6-N-acetylglucosamine synthase-like glycosyltransferase
MDEMIRLLFFSPLLQVLFLGLSLLYVLMILSFLRGWRRAVPFEERCTTPRERVTVIVPCHNEEETLPALAEALAAQEYPAELTEILLVDDHSGDNTLRVMEQIREKYGNFRILENRGRGKKEALLTALRQCGTAWVFTTDADARPAPAWISVMMAFRRHTGARFIAGPVVPEPAADLFSRLRALEFFSLTGTGLGAAATGRPLYCNGASLAYEKKLTEEHADPLRKGIPGGDDVFLLHTVKKHAPGAIRFLKSCTAVVTVKERGGLRDFFRQRRRWASKSTAYRDRDTLVTAAGVFLMNGVLLFTFFAGFFRMEWWLWFALLGMIKSGPDYLLLRAVTSFFDRRRLMDLFSLAQLFYPFYLVTEALAGVLSFSLRKKGW